MNIVAWALLVAGSAGGFASGYLLRTYLSYRRRRRLQSERYELPRGQGSRFCKYEEVDWYGDGLTPLVPGDCPASVDEGESVRPSGREGPRALH
jgi:hypothetical protein